VPSQNFALDSATRRRLGYELIDIIDQYFESLATRPVQLPLEQRSFEPLHDPLPETGVLDEVLENPANAGSNNLAARFLGSTAAELIDKGFHIPAANYFGLMNPTPTYAAVLAEALVAAINPQLATMARSQLASKIEVQTLAWIADRFGWQPPFDGSFTSGGNEANFSGLALALAGHFPTAIEDGVASIGAQPVVYASEEAHHSLDKSVGLLGLGRKALHRIRVTDSLQLDLDALRRAIPEDRAAGRKPFCVVATAGTTNSGAIDDVEAIAEICRCEGLWLHLDGAYGASAVFSDTHRKLLKGIEHSDSVTIDPHKWLAMPFSAGIILTRHTQLMRQAFGIDTPYMPKTAPNLPPDNFKVSTQWSRRMNSLKLWLTLKLHGRLAFERHIDNQMTLAANFADRITASREFEMAAPAVLPILNFRLKNLGAGNELMRKHLELVDLITQDGQRWISETRVGGQSVIRMMVVSYLTREQHLADLWNALQRAAATLVVMETK
jgi:aromatic-L-amino-acid decarboxylase